MDKTTPAFLQACARFGQSSRLVAALITVESGWNPWAVRFEPLFAWVFKPEIYAAAQGWSVTTERVLQKTSWGLLQVMGGTARDLGFKDHLTKLSIPETGLEWGLRCLSTKTARYKALDEQIAAYNAGSARRDVKGRLENQLYVDRVMKAMGS